MKHGPLLEPEKHYVTLHNEELCILYSSHSTVKVKGKASPVTDSGGP
jgi:hypothetical protein